MTQAKIATIVMNSLNKHDNIHYLFSELNAAGSLKNLDWSCKTKLGWLNTHYAEKELWAMFLLAVDEETAQEMIAQLKELV